MRSCRLFGLRLGCGLRIGLRIRECAAAPGENSSGCSGCGGGVSGIRIAAVVQRLLVGRQVGIDQAGQLLGHDLRRLHLVLDRGRHNVFLRFAGGQVLLLPEAGSAARSR